MHEVTVRQGAKVEKHLCEACAAKLGIGSPQAAPIEELLGKVLLAPGATPAKVVECPSCKMTYAEFRQSGLLGCAACYEAFEAQLTPLLERAHEGGAQHVGKSPRRAGGQGENAAQLAALAERAERLRQLQDSLKQALSREEYERAAKLRDELKELTPDTRNQPGTGPGATA